MKRHVDRHVTPDVIIDDASLLPLLAASAPRLASCRAVRRVGGTACSSTSACCAPRRGHFGTPRPRAVSKTNVFATVRQDQAPGGEVVCGHRSIIRKVA